MSKILQDTFEHHQQELLGFINKRVKDSFMAEDILQDFYIKISALKTVDDINYPKAYLYRMAKNLIIDTQRKIDRSIDNACWTDGEIESEITPLQTLQASQKLEIVTQAIEELPDKTKRAFVMHRLDDMDKSAIATKLEISVNMVEKHLRKALQFCQQRLKKLEI